MRTGLVAITVLAAVSLSAAPAAAIDFSIFGSYLDTSDVKDAPGIGARLAFFDRIQLQFSGTWYDKFDFVVLGEEIDETVSERMDLLPLDVGGAYYFKPEAQGFYINGGLSWFLLDAERSDISNEVGFYVGIGYQIKGFFLEGMYRDAEGTITKRDAEFVDRVKVDLSGYSIQAGWRF